MDRQWTGRPSSAALRKTVIDAAREFNAGRYFEAHEVLEDGLDVVPDELWDLFLGLIQIAVGYHKVTQALQSGAVRMLGLGLEKIASFPTDAAGIDLAALSQRVRADLEELRARHFDAVRFVRHPPRIRVTRA
jgi:predicted metal-dependent hydrolase